MNTNLWMRLRRLFGMSMPSRELEQILAGWRADERPGNSGPSRKRELLHPMKGWMMESPEQEANDMNHQRMVRHVAHARTRAR